MSESLKIPSCLAISCTTVRSNELPMLEVQMDANERRLRQPNSGPEDRKDNESPRTEIQRNDEAKTMENCRLSK